MNDLTAHHRISVSIVEDDTRIRESLGVLLQGMPGFRHVGSYPNAEEALKAIPADHPDVVLMDINLPNMSGIECVAKLKAQLPSVQIVMLTVYDDSDMVFRALTEGASGYIIKRTAPDRLLQAIREAYEGGSPMSPHIARKVVQYFHNRRSASRDTETLTDREREVLEHLAKGYLYKEIADALGIGLDTVRRHVTPFTRNFMSIHGRRRQLSTFKKACIRKIQMEAALRGASETHSLSVRQGSIRSSE